MMQVVSHGDRIRCGTYRLHSAFRSAVNFVSGTDFVFVVNRSVGAGPLNIVIDGSDLSGLHSLEVGNDGCWLNGSRIPLDDSRRYDSGLRIQEFDPTQIESNLNVFERALREYSHPKSLVFLIDERRKESFSSSFEREMVKRFEVGWQNIVSGDLLSGVRMIKGLGIGLTPSGDDFISGLLIALNVLRCASPLTVTLNEQSPLKRPVVERDAVSLYILGSPNILYESTDSQSHRHVGETESRTASTFPPKVDDLTRRAEVPLAQVKINPASILAEANSLLPCVPRPKGRGYAAHNAVPHTKYTEMIDTIANETYGGNPFTNSFLRCAANGWLSEKCKRLVTSLIESGEEEVISATRALLTVGETSSADQGVGLLLGLRRFSEWSIVNDELSIVNQ